MPAAGFRSGKSGRNRAPSFRNRTEIRLPHRALQGKRVKKHDRAEGTLTNRGFGRLRDQIAEGLVADGRSLTAHT